MQSALEQLLAKLKELEAEQTGISKQEGIEDLLVWSNGVYISADSLTEPIFVIDTMPTLVAVDLSKDIQPQIQHLIKD